MGPLAIDAPDTQSALWVVDGQQRLTALTVGLSRPAPIPLTPDDPWVVYFDAERQIFITPPKKGGVPSTAIPVIHLLDSSVLSEWVYEWAHGRNAALRTSVFQAGRRIREYEIPLYIVETEDEELLRDIFYRVNKFGKRLDWDDVHKALFGRKGAHPSTLPELADELQGLGMGRPEEEQLLSCLMAFKGLDVTRNIADHYRKDTEVLRNAVSEALPAIRRVLSFLKIHAEIPHLRLLPRSMPLIVLTRFFALHPEPKARTLDLLTRWTWRMLLGASVYDELTLMRRGVAAIRGSDEEQSAQALLSLVSSGEKRFLALPQRFDARAAESRIAVLGMASLRPLNVSDKKPLDIAALIEERDADAFRRILPRGEVFGSSPVNRILLPGAGSARKELVDEITSHGPDTAVLRSHGISAAAAEALLQGDVESFLKERAQVIEEAVDHLGQRLAAWSKNDRPSISYLLAQVETEA